MAHSLRTLFRNILFTSWTYIGLSLPLLAQEPFPSEIAMWKVESPNNTIYLLGSVHVGKNCRLNSSRISQAMAEAENIVFEIDFTQVSQAEKLQLSLDLAQAGRLRPGDRSLKDSISPELYEQVHQKYEELKPTNLNISLDIVNQVYRPAFIAMQIQGFQMQKLGLTGECGVDKILINQAQAENKKILALEAFTTQSKLLQTLVSAIPDRDPEKEFETLLSDISTEQVNSLLSSVITGDIQSIETKVAQSCQATPKICHTLLDERNIDWMKQIKTYLQAPEDYFIIVGAAHMIGPNSLIHLLEAANYEVTPF